jgi:hypothetical protein
VGKDSFSKFSKFWRSQIPEIKKQSLKAARIDRILLAFRFSLANAIMYDTSKRADKMEEGLMLLTELIVALEIAESNYDRNNQSMWEKIFGYAASKVSVDSIKQLISSGEKN